MNGKVVKNRKKLVAKPNYLNTAQIVLEGFDIPFERNLERYNFWVWLAETSLLNNIVFLHDRMFVGSGCLPAITSSIIFGTMIIKHDCSPDGSHTALTGL